MGIRAAEGLAADVRDFLAGLRLRYRKFRRHRPDGFPYGLRLRYRKFRTCGYRKFRRCLPDGFPYGRRRELPEIFSPSRPPALLAAAVRPVSQDHVRELFAQRVKRWSSAMGVAPKRVFLKNQRTLWGSCSARGNLNFNRALAAAPSEVVDYVVIHELAHLKEMNHSSRFWAIVNSWCPEQKSRRRWLRRNSIFLGRPK